nr:MAG TPA: putative tail component [Caudoviricetes sp.]
MGFSGDLARFVYRTQRRMIATFQTSAQILAEEIIERTPIDTGFLRASFTVSLNAPVLMDGSEGGAQNLAEIAKAGIGDTIYLGFTARYARRIEYGFEGPDSLGRVYHQRGEGMVRLSAQNWPFHVKQAIQELKAT